MGLILGRFRKKKTTFEQLEKLDTDIKSIETFREDTEIAQKRTVGHFVIYSAGIYILVAVVFYFYFFPATFYDQIFYITPLLLVPFILWGVKRLLTWYYRRKISRNESKLSTLRQEKKKLLEHVMDTETYKSAKIILEKFAPEQIKKAPASNEITPYRGSTNIVSTPLDARAMLASRNSLISAKTPMMNSIRNRTMSTPLVPQATTTNGRGQGQAGTAIVARQGNVPGTPLPMPREILPRNRSVLDKMVEYLVGDGPSNRYALVCKNCSSHNGMALREEFEYFAFRCCYCYTFNPARKLRPAAPKLEYDNTPPSHSPHSPGRRNSANSTSSSELNSGTDTEGEDKERGAGEGNKSPITASPTEASSPQEPIIALERPLETTPMEVDEEVEGEEKKTEDEKKNE